MSQEFFLQSSPELIAALSDDPAFTFDSKSQQALISNIDGVRSEVLAPEIDFYISNSSAPFREKVAGVRQLYKARAMEFDLAQDVDLTLEVGPQLAYISNQPDPALRASLENKQFSLQVLLPHHVQEITGHIGHFSILLQNNAVTTRIFTDQIIWPGAPQQFADIRGIYSPAVLSSDDIVQGIMCNRGSLNYKKYLNYDRSICLYHEKRHEICGKCAEICPGKAIVKDCDRKHLTISHFACDGCGQCVRACPSGALDYTRIPRYSFAQISQFYREATVLLLPRSLNIQEVATNLPPKVLPLTVDTLDFLDEEHLLTLIQASNHPLIIFTSLLSEVAQDIVDFINQVFQALFSAQAIYIIDNWDQLATTSTQTSPFPDTVFSLSTGNLSKKKSFTQKLTNLIDTNHLGTITPGSNLSFGRIRIDQEKCTLCLACAQSCCLEALSVHPVDSTLRFTPSLCVACGYCQKTCPEADCLSMEKGSFTLSKDSFQANIVAADELIRCVECKTEYGPKKSVEKIVELMSPLFSEDPVKLRTLYCCPDCKTKIMIENQLKQQMTAKEITPYGP